MGFFSWLHEALNPKTIELDHPYFGKLKFESGTNFQGAKFEYWIADAQLTALCSSPITVFIDAGIQGPNDEHKFRMEELSERFPQLQDAITHAQFQEWTQMRDEMRRSGDQVDEAQRFDKPETMAELFELEDIRICSDGQYELGYSIRDDVFPTLVLYFAVDKGWQVSYSGGVD